MKDNLQYNEKDVAQALTVTDMAKELGISSQGMTYLVKTRMFTKNVRAIDTRPGRRTWHRNDFRRYKKLREKLAALSSGK